MGTQALHELFRNGELGLLLPAAVFGAVVCALSSHSRCRSVLGWLFVQQSTMRDRSAHVIVHTAAPVAIGRGK